MFGFIKKALHKVYDQFTSKIQSIFFSQKVDTQTLDSLEKILIGADTGVQTTRNIISNLKKAAQSGKIQTGQDLKIELKEELTHLLKTKKFDPQADIYLLVGINGSGKTTASGKLTYWLKQQNKKVLLVAGDTFRAAATQQLNKWAEKLSTDIVIGKENQDPASVVFEGCQKFKDLNYGALIIDTAGRLQTKVNLMKELEKIKRIIEKLLPDKKISTLLTVDSMLGQNSFEQAKIFNESTKLDGIILTKMDGTAKGGIVFSIVNELQIPVAFISYGENEEQFALFDPIEYCDDLLKE